jgi:C_GCAxxG_C_C family probable redox protein
MTADKITKDEIVRYFKGGIDCSQVVLMQWATELGYDEEEAARMAAAFGGGMFNGDTCGAVSGAMIVIGLEYGHFELDDPESKTNLMEKVDTFLKKFMERRGTTICRELTKYDFSQEGELEKAIASGILFEFCPYLVLDALEILDEIM